MDRNYGPPAVRHPNRFDIVLAHAVAFIQKLTKQMLVTLGVSSLRAAADFMLKSGDEKVTGILQGNLSRETNTPTSQSPYGGSSYNDSSYYDRYNRQYSSSRGAETFPGFH